MHPQVSIHLAQWCSPKFAVMVSKWVFELMTKGHVSLNGQSQPISLTPEVEVCIAARVQDAVKNALATPKDDIVKKNGGLQNLETHARALSPEESSKAALLADKILQRFKNGDKLKDGMSLRDFRRMFKAKSENDTLDNALELLSEFGWVKILKVKTSGRAKSVICVNPILFDDEKKNGRLKCQKCQKFRQATKTVAFQG